MDRRKFVGMLGAAAAGLPAAAHAKAAPGARDNRPNFLFLIGDDFTFRAMDALTHSAVKTPNLDRLAVRGCTMTHCFHQGSWMGAVCVASRTMLNTGLTGFHAQFMTQRVAHFQPDNLDDSIPTWGGTLGAAGYETYMVGKWHLDPPLLARSFEHISVVGPGMLPSTSVTGDAYHRPAPGNHWNPADRNKAGHWMRTRIMEQRTRSNGEPEIRHSSEIYADHAIHNLKTRITASDRPFFMYVGFNAPHDPRQSPQEFLDMYPADSIEVPPNFLPEHPFNEGEHGIRDEVIAPFPRTRRDVQVHRREYYAIISHMDAQIGRILDALEATGKADNTYVIMAADHGLCVGEHGLMGKQNMYEASIRMPLILAGPRIPAGKRVDELVYQHSMFATTCELAGIPVPQTVEHPSFASMLTGTPSPMHDAIFSYYKYYSRTVRTKQHKLIVYPQVGVTQLFAIDRDPWELHNLADDPSMASVRAEMLARLRKLQAELGDRLDLDHPSKPPVVDAIYNDN